MLEPADDIHLDAVLFEHLKHSDVGKPARRAGRKGQPDLASAHFAAQPPKVRGEPETVSDLSQISCEPAS